jgi:uncharacterized membrane protein
VRQVEDTRHGIRVTALPTTALDARRHRFRLPGIVVGVGIGALLDGVVLHQILQWHHMLSGDGALARSTSTVDGLEANTLADGLFHAVALAITLVGVFLLRSRIERLGRAPSTQRMAGYLLIGWGGFNVVEGLIDHELLGIHHVRDDLGGPVAWDLGALVVGALLALAGFALVASDDRRFRRT